MFVYTDVKYLNITLIKECILTNNFYDRKKNLDRFEHEKNIVWFSVQNKYVVNEDNITIFNTHSLNNVLQLRFIHCKSKQSIIFYNIKLFNCSMKLS